MASEARSPSPGAMDYFPAYSNALWEAYKANAYSQNGEDGLMAELLARLGIREGWVVEAGAWDGIHLSNTFALLRRGGFRALYVEGDAAKYADLMDTTRRLPPGTIVPVNCLLRSDEDTLGEVMRRHGLPAEPVVLSLDIDSWDYDVWANLDPAFKPAVVVIEIESGVHPLEWKIHGRDGWQHPTSFLPMLMLGAEKGYKLVAHSGNMVFVRADLWARLGVPDVNPLSCFRSSWLVAQVQERRKKL